MYKISKLDDPEEEKKSMTLGDENNQENLSKCAIEQIPHHQLGKQCEFKAVIKEKPLNFRNYCNSYRYEERHLKRSGVTQAQRLRNQVKSVNFIYTNMTIVFIF